MSDILTIDTEAGVVTEERMEELPLYDERLPMLDSEIPTYNLRLPNPHMTKLVKQMKMTMKKFGGIGLSANQCGVYERVFIIGFLKSLNKNYEFPKEDNCLSINELEEKDLLFINNL